MTVDERFLALIRSKSVDELKTFIEEKYNYFIKRHGIPDVSFGINGANEFIAALFLADYDQTTTKKIYDNLDMYFGSRCRNPLHFSDFMDTVVNESCIKYQTWSEAFKYFYYSHKAWIRYLRCAS
ncbi:hypothetical protein [Geomonas agri]|uniref:hypothetical protein n=1 Tax=Geomonas agri TaxID=2873702 RepID=UPI001CD259A7|nr:hypothetical protein [Geomonas agri]